MSTLVLMADSSGRVEIANVPLGVEISVTGSHPMFQDSRIDFVQALPMEIRTLPLMTKEEAQVLPLAPVEEIVKPLEVPPAMMVPPEAPAPEAIPIEKPPTEILGIHPAIFWGGVAVVGIVAIILLKRK